MAFGNLTPIEKRNEYYATIQLGKDVKTQTELISHSTKAMIATQINSTNAIIASRKYIQEGMQGDIQEGIDNLSYSVAEVSEGMQGLKAAFEFGISEVVWQIEQNREILQNILDVLMAPLGTQAKELRRRAEDSYSNGWFDEAFEDFLESEKINKYDFSVHISLGMLYLFQKADKTKAYESFEKAVKYARPKSRYHASLSLLHLAIIKRDMNEIEEAEKLTAEAIQLSPGFVEALYQNAQYNGKLKRVDKCIRSLTAAIKADKMYCLKADKDEMFDPVRSHVNMLFDQLRSVESSKATSCFKKIKQKHDKIISILKNISKDKIINLSLEDEIINVSSYLSSANKIGSDYNKLNSKRGRNSYFDFLGINKKLPVLLENQESLIKNVKQKMSQLIKYRRKDVNGIKANHDSRTETCSLFSGILLMYGSFIVPILGVLFLFPDGYKLWFVAFLIPWVSQILSLYLIYSVVTSSDTVFFSSNLMIPGHNLGWILILFLIVLLAGFIISRLISKSKIDEEVTNNKKNLEAIVAYLKKCRLYRKHWVRSSFLTNLYSMGRYKT